MIIISGHGNIDMAVQAIKDEQIVYEKPLLQRLLLSVGRSIELYETKNENNLKNRDIYNYKFINSN